MQLNLGILILVLCLGSVLCSAIGQACPDKGTFGTVCKNVSGWTGSVFCLASCVLMIMSPFRSSIR